MALPSLIRRNREVAPTSADPFLTLRREMDRLFDEAFRGFGLPMIPDAATWAPTVDVRETENGLEVVAELPGVNEKDVEVTVSDGVLTLRGEKNIDRNEKSNGWHIVERSQGSFTRSIALPMDVDQDKASAEFKNGVLRIVLPASPGAEKKVRRIAVKAG
jgi:HSP20 family protein